VNYVALSGRIADGVSLADHLDGHAPGPVVVDTEGVTFVNSVGMRELVRLLRGLRERGHEVRMERVADVLMTQLNLFADARQLTIASFHAQYVCPACGAESAPLVEVAPHLPLLRALKAPQMPCPECGAAMDLGDFPERYLSVFKG
jgi:predicted RNA-binding Zn-ribbon protein involved in translation (DUF1610 family)